jgi:hypothetical protein
VVVLVGVGVCTVSDVSVNAQGLVAAVIAVCGTALQQHVSIENVTELFYLLLYIICYFVGGHQLIAYQYLPLVLFLLIVQSL